jgi:4-amino-4-deoxy-L-arabinose transferase-like glycosyltransferase
LRTSKAAVVRLGLILGLGAALRLAFYLSRPSLSIDETMLGLEIGGGTRSFAGLLHPLGYAQTAPIPFLWLVRLSTTLGGMHEYALRAVPLVAGLLVLVLVWRVARRVLPEPAALLATALAALAPALVQFSVTMKPYVTDALLAVLLLDFTLQLLDRPGVNEAPPRRLRRHVLKHGSAAGWWRLGLAGVVAVAASTAAPFVLAGVAGALAISTAGREPGARWRLVACGAAWAAVFVPLYLVAYRPVATSAYMQQFWGASFFQPGSGAGWRQLGRALVQALVARPAPLVAILPFAALVVIGLWWLGRRHGVSLLALLGLPLVTLLAASLVHRYPLSARLLLFAAPSLVLCCAAAVAAAAAWRPGAGWALGSPALLMLVGIHVTHPYRTPATRRAVAALVERAGAGEPIYVASGGVPAWAFYTTDWSSPDTGYLGRVRRWAGEPGAAAFHNRAPRGRAVAADEGEHLVVRRGGRLELVGLAPGIQWREGMGFGGRSVVADSGWASREAARIRAAAAPSIWVFVANPYPATVRDLYAALERAGARLETASAVGGVRLARFRFTSVPSPN